MLRKEVEEFDEVFPDGVFAFPPDPQEPRVKVRALGEYCKKKGITPSEISEEEIRQFLVVNDTMKR